MECAPHAMCSAVYMCVCMCVHAQTQVLPLHAMCATCQARELHVGCPDTRRKINTKPTVLGIRNRQSVRMSYQTMPSHALPCLPWNAKHSEHCAEALAHQPGSTFSAGRTIAGCGQFRHDGKLHEVGQAEVAHDARAAALAEGAVAPPVVAVEEGHILSHRGAWHGHARKHADAFGHVHKCQLLWRGHYHSRRELHRLRAQKSIGAMEKDAWSGFGLRFRAIFTSLESRVVALSQWFHCLTGSPFAVQTRARQRMLRVMHTNPYLT